MPYISHSKTTTPFQGKNHLKSILLRPKHHLKNLLCSSRPEQWIYRVFPSVTNEWPFQNHLPSKTFISPRWPLSLGWPEKWMQRAKPSQYHWCMAFFKTNNKYASQMPHMPISAYADMRQLCQCIYLILTQCNHQCDYKYWYTYISHYWHMPLNMYACHIAYVCPTALLLWSTYRPNTRAYICKK